ncbi:SPOR domain-containing protein [Dyella sp. KRB-257]|uniref:SPOR domain-containing protein n=1 Tax=Dyella sp. KRB-257 TaxID=3400915 RepID=UPI003C0FF605
MKTRLLGAFVLIALLVLFVPMFFPSSPPTAAGDQTVSLAIPPAPDRDLQTRTMSLDPDAAAPAAAASAGAVVIPAAQAGSGDRLATVDIRSRRPTDVETGAAATPAGHADTASPPAGRAPTTAPAPVKPAAGGSAIKSQSPASASPRASAPVLPPATAARGNYSLSLSAYASGAGARSLMQRVRKLGYPVSSHVIQQGDKSLTAVEAGPFATRTAAESARLKITQSIAGVPVRLESGASTPAGDEPAGAAPKASARAGGWAVQVAAMSSQSDANALRDKLRANGFDGFVDSVTVGGRKLWRVRAGPQTQRSDAERVRDQIKSRLGLAGNVVGVP